MKSFRVYMLPVPDVYITCSRRRCYLVPTRGTIPVPRTGCYISLLDYSINVTLQDFSSPAATRSFICKLRALQPAAAKPATYNKLLRTAAGSEESRREET